MRKSAHVHALYASTVTGSGCSACIKCMHGNLVRSQASSQYLMHQTTCLLIPKMALIACLVFMLGLPSLSSANAPQTKPRKSTLVEYYCKRCMLHLTSRLSVTHAGSCPVTYPVSASDVMSRVDVATSSTFSSVPRDFVSLVTTWCSDSPVENNHFNLTFSEPILIKSVIITGGSGAPLFVSEFSLLFQENATDTFRLYKQV